MKNNSVEVVDNFLKVDLDVMIKEAIRGIKSCTKVDIKDYSIKEDKVILELNENTNLECLTVLKDRLKVKENSNKLSYTGVNNIKHFLINYLKPYFKDIEIFFNSIEQTDDIVLVYLKLYIPEIDAKILVTYKIYSDENTNLSYYIFGDDNKYIEKWVSTSASPEELLTVLLDVKNYYKNKTKKLN